MAKERELSDDNGSDDSMKMHNYMDIVGNKDVAYVMTSARYSLKDGRIDDGKEQLREAIRIAKKTNLEITPCEISMLVHRGAILEIYEDLQYVVDCAAKTSTSLNGNEIDLYRRMAKYCGQIETLAKEFHNSCVNAKTDD